MSNKIIRTPTKAEGGITEKEKQELKKISEKYIANAFKTGRTDKQALTKAIKNLYKVSGLKEPRVVVVPSPLVMALAYGLASGVWSLRKKNNKHATNNATTNSAYFATINATDIKTRNAITNATYFATLRATDNATENATYLATNNATLRATRNAARKATYRASDDATLSATHYITHDATNYATYDATENATENATDDAISDATYHLTIRAIDDAIDDATYDAIRTKTDNATYYATYNATDNATDIATRNAIIKATNNATDSATDNATRFAIDNATRFATDIAARKATYRAIDESILNATLSATDDATYDATNRATDIATRNATYDATLRATRNAARKATYRASDDATNRATYNATYDATDDATYLATQDATYDATRNATYDATRNSTDIKTRNAITNATDKATTNSTYNATYDATYNATINATDNKIKTISIKDIAQLFVQTDEDVDFLLSNLNKWTGIYQGGNMWSGFLAYAEAMRDVIRLKGLDCWDKYQAWEDAGKLGGFRAMHEEFCLVSDFPDFIHVDENNQPHSETGPSHRWSDGFEIYSLLGVQFKKELWQKVISTKMSFSDIMKIENADQKAVAMHYNPNAVLENGAKLIDKDIKGNELFLVEGTEINEETGYKSMWYVKMPCPTGRTFVEAVPVEIGEKRDASEAQAFLCGLTKSEYLSMDQEA